MVSQMRHHTIILIESVLFILRQTIFIILDFVTRSDVITVWHWTIYWWVMARGEDCFEIVFTTRTTVRQKISAALFIWHLFSRWSRGNAAKPSITKQRLAKSRISSLLKICSEISQIEKAFINAGCASFIFVRGWRGERWPGVMTPRSDQGVWVWDTAQCPCLSLHGGMIKLLYLDSDFNTLWE